MAVQARWWNQGGEVVNELLQGEEQRATSVALGLRKTIDDLLLADLLDALNGEGRARAVAATG